MRLLQSRRGRGSEDQNRAADYMRGSRPNRQPWRNTQSTQAGTNTFSQAAHPGGDLPPADLAHPSPPGGWLSPHQPSSLSEKHPQACGRHPHPHHP